MRQEATQEKTPSGVLLKYFQENNRILTERPTIDGNRYFKDLNDPTKRPLWEIDPDFINPYKELPPLQTWCFMGDRKAIPKEGIITFSAKQKRGKSLSTYAFAIPLLKGSDFGTIHPIDRPNLIMVFDMEMGETTLTNRVRNQITTIGEYGNRFVVCNLKAKSIEDRITTIQEKVNAYNPDIIVIDQAAKLVRDINSTTETNIITDMLDKLSIGRSVWVVMHENKGDDTNMRGHLGSYLSFANVEAYTVDYKGGLFTVTYKEGRDTDPNNAEPLQFAIDTNNGCIVDGSEQAKQAQDTERSKWVQNMKHLFADDESLSYSDVVSRIQQEGNGIKPEDAKNKFRKACEIGALIKTGTGKRDPYTINATP